MNVEVEVDDAEVVAMLNRVRGRIANDQLGTFLANKPLRFLQKRIARRFDAEGDDVTGKWPELRPSTAMIRKQQGYGAYHPINVRTTALFNFVKTAKIAGPVLTMPGRAPSGVMRSKFLTAQKGGFGTTGGGSGRAIGPRRPAPPRPVLGLNETDATAIQTQLERWVMSGGK